MYNENYKTFLKEIKETQINGNTCHGHGLEDLLLSKFHTTQRNLQIQCNHYQNSNELLCRTKITHSKIHIKSQATWNSQNSHKREEQT